MSYDSYKDSNGVTWTITGTGRNGEGLARERRDDTMLAYVPDGAARQYDPPAEDQLVKLPAGGIQVFGVDVIPGAEITPEQTRTLFLELRDKIEAYAAAHKSDVALRVTAHAGLPWWAIAVGIGAAALLFARRQ